MSYYEKKYSLTIGSYPYLESEKSVWSGQWTFVWKAIIESWSLHSIEFIIANYRLDLSNKDAKGSSLTYKSLKELKTKNQNL